MTEEEKSRMLAEIYRQQQLYGGCGPQMMMYLLIGVIVLLFASCTTKSMVETDVSYQKLTEATSRIDSLIHTTSTWQQSIFLQQTALVDSFKSKEVRDTSRTVFLGEKGDTIKEKIVIKEYYERDHQSSETNDTWYSEITRQTDSLLHSNQVLSSKVDSLLHIHNKETVVQKGVPWYKRWLQILYPFVIITLIIYVVYLRFFRKSNSS